MSIRRPLTMVFVWVAVAALSLPVFLYSEARAEEKLDAATDSLRGMTVNTDIETMPKENARSLCRDFEDMKMLCSRSPRPVDQVLPDVVRLLDQAGDVRPLSEDEMGQSFDDRGDEIVSIKLTSGKRASAGCVVARSLRTTPRIEYLYCSVLAEVSGVPVLVNVESNRTGARAPKPQFDGSNVLFSVGAG